jgi:nucleoside-diphosphate-sugar epimerase
VYNVNDDSQMTQIDLMRYMAQLTGHLFFKLPPIPVEPIKKVAEPLLRTVQKLAQNFKIKLPVEADTIAYLNMDFTVNNEKLKSTGYKFIYPDARHGLRDTVQWYRNEGWI